MTILVTGGLGAIGSWAVKELVQRDIRPVIFDFGNDVGILSSIEGKFDLIQGDLTKFEPFLDVVKQYKVKRIIHLAGVGMVVTEPNPAKGFEINAIGTVNVLEAARLTGVERVVYASSKSVYGSIEGEYADPLYRSVPEDYRKEPDTLYGSLKVFGEDLLAHYHRQFGLDYVVMRFGSTYGPGKLRAARATHGVSMLIENAVNGIPAHLPKGGDQVDDLIYNKDVGRGLVLGCFAEKPLSRYYHLATGVGVTLKDVVTLLKQRFPKADISVGDGLDYYDLGRNVYGILSTDKARDEIGFVAEFNIESGIEDYAREMLG